MWTRGELSKNAKAVLKRTYWLSFAICFVTGILTGVSRSASTMFKLQERFDINFPLSVIGVVFLFTILYTFFITNPILVGLNNFFLSSRQYDVYFGKLFSSFSADTYLNVIKIVFLRRIFEFLWSLLFIVPGIIKHYEYFFVSYILAENPKLSRKRVFEISKDMTNEDKLNIFGLQLYLVVCRLLGLFACLVGVYFVEPYVQAVNAELYAAKREDALRYGYATESELCGFYGEEM